MIAIKLKLFYLYILRVGIYNLVNNDFKKDWGGLYTFVDFYL